MPILAWLSFLSPPKPTKQPKKETRSEYLERKRSVGKSNPARITRNPSTGTNRLTKAPKREANSPAEMEAKRQEISAYSPMNEDHDCINSSNAEKPTWSLSNPTDKLDITFNRPLLPVPSVPATPPRTPPKPSLSRSYGTRTITPATFATPATPTTSVTSSPPTPCPLRPAPASAATPKWKWTTPLTPPTTPQKPASAPKTPANSPEKEKDKKSKIIMGLEVHSQEYSYDWSLHGWKRWVCCQCDCETHWENNICSNLDCLHGRCEGCEVVEVTRQW